MSAKSHPGRGFGAPAMLDLAVEDSNGMGDRKLAQVNLDLASGSVLFPSSDEPCAELRHDLRNRLAGLRHATHYIRQKLEGSRLAQEDPRLADLLVLMEDEL